MATGQTMNVAELAYFAGLFDGEGCIHAHFGKDCRGRRRQARLKVTVGMVNPTAVRELQLLYGGSVQRRVPKSARERTAWIWWLGQRASARFLSDMLPYLRVKHEEARLALLLYARIKTAPKVSKGRQGTLPLTDEEYAARAEIVGQIRNLKHSEFLQ